jgi:SpoVK/Ycf46/Vps4 family AAA+-type ATPase
LDNTSKYNSRRPNSISAAQTENCIFLAGGNTLEDIVGQPDAINELKEFRNSLMFQKVYSYWKIQPPKGILFEGPPGTGKTECVRALANELRDVCSFMEIRSIDIASRYMDAPIESLREYFKVAENLAKTKHVVVFIDEIDSMLSNRQEQLHEVSIKRVNTFLEWMDGGFSSISGITIIGATNNLSGIDGAF